MIYPMVPFPFTLSDPIFQGHGVIIDAVGLLRAQLTRDLFAIAKFLFYLHFVFWCGLSSFLLNSVCMYASCSTLASSSSSTQQTTIVDNRFRPSHSVYNSWQYRRCDDGHARLQTAFVWRQVEQEALLIFEYILLKNNISPETAEGYECGNRISGPTSV